MKKIFCLQIFILLVIKIYAINNVTISGFDTAYSGKEVIFNKYAEQITNSEFELARCVIAKDGSFSLSFQVEDVTFIFSYIGVYRLCLFVEPNKTYNIILPPKEEKEPDDFVNPYFSPIIVYLGTKQYDENELNIQIRMFSDAYQPYYSKHVEEKNVKNDFAALDNDIAQMEKPFASSNNQFFNNYRKYRYGLLRQLALQQKSKSLSDEYFKDKPVLYDNPAYMELFNQVYNKYFYRLSQTDQGKELANNIGAKDLSGLQKTLSSGGVLGKGELRDLVLLKGIYDEFYDDHYSRSAMLAILDNFISSTKIPQLKDIAKSIRSKTTKLLAGFEPPAFNLYDQDSNLLSLDNFKGKYVYLNFCSCFSYTCLNEFVMLDNLYQKYKDRLEIVTIIIDDDENVLKSFLSRSKYNWKFLYFGHQSGIIKDYDVRAFPTYYLIDPQGKLAMSPAPSPEEDFEARFFQLMRSRGNI